MTACFSSGLRGGARPARAARAASGVLLWGSLGGCAQLLGIEVYEEREVLENAPGAGEPALGAQGVATLGDDAGAGGARTGGSAGGGGAPDGSDDGSDGSGDDAGGELACSPGARRCADNVIERCSPGGAWLEEAACVDQTCTASGAAAACGGECAPGQTRCQGGDAYECERGRWDLADACAATEVCRAGGCVDAQRDVGNAGVMAGAVPLPGDTMVLYRLPALARDALLERFGVVGDVEGVQARLVLYGDGPDGLAPAGDVIAETGGQSFALAAGEVVTAAPASPGTLLERGVAYWVGVITAEATTLRGGAAASAPLRVVPFAPFNAPFGRAEPGQVGPERHLNVFIGVREQP